MLLAEFTKSVPAFDRAIPGPSYNCMPLYAELYDVLRGLFDILGAFKLAGEQKLPCPFDGLGIRLLLLHRLFDQRSIVNLYGHVRIVLRMNTRHVRLPG